MLALVTCVQHSGSSQRSSSLKSTSVSVVYVWNFTPYLLQIQICKVQNLVGGGRSSLWKVTFGTWKEVSMSVAMHMHQVHPLTLLPATRVIFTGGSVTVVPLCIVPPLLWSPCALFPLCCGPPVHCSPSAVVPLCIVPPLLWSPCALFPLCCGPPVHCSPSAVVPLCIVPPLLWSPCALFPCCRAEVVRTAAVVICVVVPLSPSAVVTRVGSPVRWFPLRGGPHLCSVWRYPCVIANNHSFQNEAMTGQLTFNPVFSRITFAALEDSG